MSRLDMFFIGVDAAVGPSIMLPLLALVVIVIDAVCPALVFTILANSNLIGVLAPTLEAEPAVYITVFPVRDI